MMTAPPLSTSFMRCLLEQNRQHLGGFRKWLFQTGMLFHSRETWWGLKKTRPGPHEGLDLCSFADVHGQERRLPEHTRIPAALAGTVVNIHRDFLGRSIFMVHEVFADDGRQLLSAYGHTQPLDAVAPGKRVAAGEIIATLAGGSGKKGAVPVHLHITFAWAPAPLNPRQLTWPNLGQDPAITLLDPRPILGLAP